MRCGRCGNENAEANRFCGMCGAALVGKDPAGGQAPVGVGSGGSTAERRAASSPPGAGPRLGPSSEPVITGPSFLGLGAPAGGTGGGRGDHQADGGHDALRPSSNVDYLLEDVEEPHRSRGKMILVVAALALAVGFGYLHWRRGGFDWLNAGDKKPSAAATQTPDAGQAGGESAATPAAGAAPQAGAGTAPGGASPADSGAGQTAPAQTAAPASGDAAPATTPQSAEQQSAPQNSAGDSAPQAADSEADKQVPEVKERPRAARKAAKLAPSKLPATKPAAGRAGDSVTEAERYIYGRGAEQDCERGLRILKPAAESNVKAMISMGAMYSTGTCTPRDLPTAYRWFALALHKEPDNQSLQEDLQKLWGQMTQPERQLAIKLSQ